VEAGAVVAPDISLDEEAEMVKIPQHIQMTTPDEWAVLQDKWDLAREWLNHVCPSWR